MAKILPFLVDFSDSMPFSDAGEGGGGGGGGLANYVFTKVLESGVSITSKTLNGVFLKLLFDE